MLDVLQILSVVLVVGALAPALAHALELPGKMRLTKSAYLTVQPIYYPGFTIGGGSAEAASLILTVVLVFLTPVGSIAFWLTLVAALGLIGMQAVYWLVTHPVNRFWLQAEELNALGSGFFSLGSGGRPEREREAIRCGDWTELRDRWEYSHVARAALSAVSFISLVLLIAR